MYAPAPFDQPDAQAMLALMRAHPFAHVLVNGEGGPVAAHVPVCVETDAAGAPATLVAHVARANPFWRAAEEAGRALAIFAGPHAYVSASLYPSKAEHGRMVPTWNYMAVEARGRIAVETDPAAMRAYVEVLTDTMEAGRAPAWRVSDAPEDYVGALLRGIVGLRVAIDSLAGKWKLSQNRSAADFEAVRAALGQSAGEDDRAVAAAMARVERSNGA